MPRLAQQSPYGGAAPERELPKGLQSNEGFLSLSKVNAGVSDA